LLTGLYILPVIFILFSSSFLMISRRTIISQSFNQMKAFWVQMNDLDLLFQYLKGRCHGNQFCEKMANSALSLLWHSETEWDNAMCMHDLMALLMPLYLVKFW